MNINNINENTIQKFIEDNLNLEKIEKLAELYKINNEFKQRVDNINDKLDSKLTLLSQEAHKYLYDKLSLLSEEEFLDSVFPEYKNFTLSIDKKEHWEKILVKLEKTTKKILKKKDWDKELKGIEQDFYNWIMSQNADEIEEKFSVSSSKFASLKEIFPLKGSSLDGDVCWNINQNEHELDFFFLSKRKELEGVEINLKITVNEKKFTLQDIGDEVGMNIIFDFTKEKVLPLSQWSIKFKKI